MKLVVTIDTEEDNWGRYLPDGYTLENIRRIPVLQGLFDEFNVKPTYLITYPVATDERAISILKGIMDEGRCEIGTHCHPWNTPPFEEDFSEKNTILCNLPQDLQYRKISHLHNAIIKKFGVIPVSFRSGRWGYDEKVAKNIHRLGYRIDSSITPFIDWSDSFGYNFTNYYMHAAVFSCKDIFRDLSTDNLLEVPITIGFLQQNFSLCNKIISSINGSAAKHLRLIGILDRLKLINKVWLSPEFSDSENMIKLTNVMMKKNYEVINMSFHSTSLIAGLSPFVKSREDEKIFIKRIREFILFTQNAGIESIRLRDALDIYKANE